MIRANRREQKPFSEYVRLLLQLHALISEGLGDTDEADEIRDRMDHPWKNLSPEQLKLVDGLSADLYTLGVDRPVPTSQPDKQEWDRFHDAANREDWSVALELLRKNEADLPAAQVAYIRGACWAYLTQPDVAVTFLREKQRIAPLEAGEEVLLLTCLVQAERLEEATARAREIAEKESAPALLLKAAEVLFVDASLSQDAETESLHRAAIDVAERGLQLGKTGSTDELFESLQPNAFLHMALSYDQLGQKESAVRFCERALQIDPNHFEALMLYGYLTYGKYPQDDKPAFRGQEHRRLIVSPAAMMLPSNLVSSR